MKTLILTTALALIAATAGCGSMDREHDQHGGATTAAAAGGHQGMGPRMGHAMGPGHAMGMMGTGHGNDEAATPGWSMMSDPEREEHRLRMRSGMSSEQCQHYLQAHHQRMVERAKERGVAPPAAVQQSLCGGRAH